MCPKPLVIAIAFPSDGHTHPVLRAATELVKRGFPIWFVCGSKYHTTALAAGISRVFTFPDAVDICPHIMDGYRACGPRMEAEDYVMREIFVRYIPIYAQVLLSALKEVEVECRENVVIMQDLKATATLPFLHGAPVPGYGRFPPVLSLGICVITTRSVDAPPNFWAVNPMEVNMLKLHEEHDATIAGSLNLLNETMEKMGGTRSAEYSVLHTWWTSPDLTLQLCSPSLEFKRRDLDPKIRFAGGLPVPPKTSTTPDWLRNLVAKKKKVVFVSQGTIDNSFHQLLLPAIQGLASRDKLVVILTMGKRGAVPPVKNRDNIYMVDYIPYADILPFTDVFVNNGGYGGFMQAVMSGVPMVVAGESKDKANVALRLEYAGLGINLNTATPTPGLILAAVEQVLEDPRYKKKALELRKENEDMDCIGRIESGILELFHSR
ncbi:uncharacterized protein PpBr36_10727 [Pyricularia pennisetigena]|uniref:uncharacterized protein n=1 Tax=Pyricularia pennisetigena TaxID=1578925 RepID=UPI001151800F|nr:uncharacterized protein PpBr36_10727 [Pyricularia pennisetigena]TLS21046.1 hypothetical protein PpBr36_10727 [Pyricularia pennisetigena]